MVNQVKTAGFEPSYATRGRMGSNSRYLRRTRPVKGEVGGEEMETQRLGFECPSVPFLIRAKRFFKRN